MSSHYKTWQYWREEWVKPLIYALIIAFFIRTFIAQPFKIPSSSMEKTLRPGDRIFVNKFIYGAKIPFTNLRLPKFKDPERGDVIVFLSPAERKKYLVKRLIGKPGDVVEIKNNRIWIDKAPLESPLFFKGKDYYNLGQYGVEGKPIFIPDGFFFALGDNSLNSVDSRYWGLVPKRNLVGKVFLIHWPIPRIRIINKNSYEPR